jgi:hypothetical protein
MRWIVDISAVDTVPSVEAILRAQGIPSRAHSEERLRQMALQAQERYRALVKPVGLVADIRKTEFESVYFGEGRNESPAPVEDILGQSNHLALFSVTAGEKLTREISRLLAENEFAPAAMLDATASEGAELAARQIELAIREHLEATNLWTDGYEIMSFSPGYCGWHVSAQKRLFEFLKPQEIGITLTDSCMMQPLKSISGVAVIGRREIFDIDDSYTFCKDCKTHSCRERYEAI